MRSQRVWVGPGFVTIDGYEYHLDEPLEVIRREVYRAKNTCVNYAVERVGEWVHSHYRHLGWLGRLLYPRAPRPDLPHPPTKPLPSGSLPEARALIRGFPSQGIKKGPR